MTDYSKVDPETGDLLTENSAANTLVESLDPIFTTLFTLESALKIIGMGFIGETGAYFRDPWSWLDFVVVVAGYVKRMLTKRIVPRILPTHEISLELIRVMTNLPGVPKVSALRVFRVLRPLRSLNRVAGTSTEIWKKVPH